MRLVVSLLLLASLAGCTGDTRATRTRFLLFGIDGATWNVIDPLLEQGKLPNLARLIRNGSRGSLSTLTPTKSPRIWTSMVTGVLPEEHGILDFVVESLATKEKTLPSSNMRWVKALWNILSENGHSVGVVNWWASFPAEEVNGFIISDRANYARKSAYKSVLGLTGKDMIRPVSGETWPPGLYEEILPFIELSPRIDPELVSRIVTLPAAEMERLQRQTGFSRESKLSIIKFGLLQDESSVESGLYALGKYRPDFLAFYFNGLDGVEHHYWKYMEPEAFPDLVTEEEVELWGEVIPSYYGYVDSVLGRFLDAYGDEPLNVMVVSDHGQEADPSHGSDNPTSYSVLASGHHENAPPGVVILAGPDFAPGAELSRASVLDVTPTVLALMGLPVARDMSGRALTEAIRLEFLEAWPITSIATYTSDEWAGERSPVASDRDDEMKERLRALGYID